jgi:hypothetical protein
MFIMSPLELDRIEPVLPLNETNALNDFHGTRRFAYHSLVHAAQHHLTKTTPTVRADNHKVSLPVFGEFDNVVSRNSLQQLSLNCAVRQLRPNLWPARVNDRADGRLAELGIVRKNYLHKRIPVLTHIFYCRSRRNLTHQSQLVSSMNLLSTAEITSRVRSN